MIILLVSMVRCQLIINEQIFNVDYTYEGFIPYGQNLTGVLHFVSDLCQQKNYSGVILANYSTEFSFKEQIYNAQSGVVIFSYDIYLLSEVFLDQDRSFDKGVLLMINNSEFLQLKDLANQSVKLIFPIPKSDYPEITYIIKTMDQPVDVLQKLLESKEKGFFFKITPVCLTWKASFGKEKPYNLHERNDKYPLEQVYSVVVFTDSKMNKRKILNENIHQLCILQTHGDDIWMMHRIQYVEVCQKLRTSSDIQKCSQNIGSEYINETLVQNCYQDSFVTTHIQNTILDQQVNLKYQNTETLHNYSVYFKINQQTIYGNYRVADFFNTSVSTVINALCRSYLSNVPSACLINEEKPIEIIPQIDLDDPQPQDIVPATIEYDNKAMKVFIVVSFVAFVFYFLKIRQVRINIRINEQQLIRK